MKDPLNNYVVYNKAYDLYENVKEDTYKLEKDLRGREIARQLIRSAGSITANFEEGYGRGYTQDFIRFLKYSRGSARETKGWYLKSKNLLDQETLKQRIQQTDEIIYLLISMIKKIEQNQHAKKVKSV